MFGLGSLWMLLAFFLLLIPGSVEAWPAEEFDCSQEKCQHRGHVCDFSDGNVNDSDEQDCE